MLIRHVPNLLLYLEMNKFIRETEENLSKFIPSSGGEPNIFDSIHVDKRRCSLK